MAVVIDTWFPAVGGGQINALEISKRIARNNVTVEVLTRNNGYTENKNTKNFIVHQLGEKAEATNYISRIRFIVNVILYLYKNKYDVIHLHAFLPGLLAPLVRYILKKPVIFTVHGTRMFEEHPTKTLGYILEKIILTWIKYDLQISVTKRFLNFKNINKVIYIPNAVNYLDFDRIQVKKAIYPKILWVGRFDKVKRVEDLIAASKIVTEKINNVKFFLVGYGCEEKRLKMLKNKMKAKNVIFTGKKTGIDLIREYKSSHLFVLTSSSEGQPITVLEAQAASLPIVATNVGGVGEIVKDGVNGFLVSSNNTKEIANAIVLCIQGGMEMGKHGYESVKKHFSWNIIAQKTLNVYKDVM